MPTSKTDEPKPDWSVAELLEQNRQLVERGHNLLEQLTGLMAEVAEARAKLEDVCPKRKK